MQGGAPTEGSAVRVEVLGPLRLLVGGTAVEVPGPKRRAVLALLARAEGRVVAVADLVESLWPGEPVGAARASLHSHVSRLRGHLGPAADRLATLGHGYQLRLDGGDLDVTEVRRLVRQARQLAGGDPAGAHRLLTEARSRWRGAVLPDLAEVAPIAAWTLALTELRREVEDQYLACALAAGYAGEVVGAAREAVAADPLRETSVRLLMRALAGTGRDTDALGEGYAYRRRLAEHSGLDPSPALAELERAIAAGTAAGGRPSGVDGPDRTGEVGGVGGVGGPGGMVGPAPVRPATRVVGRDAALTALQRLVDDERLVTVIGPGGVGKTSLVLELARRLPEVRVLPLAPVTDPAAVPYALAAALGLRAVAGDVVAACTALLGAGPQVLVVDNCEHLLPAVRQMVSTLLARCSRLTVLATGREPLALAAERQFRLAPLPLPGPADIGTVTQVPSVALFLTRAQRVRGGFAPGPAELRLVSEVVHRLDGMPLAIELAAGRLSSLSLADLHARLDRALDLLGDGRSGDSAAGPAADPRHRTLRATLDWSYQLLGPDEQRLFRNLSVFPDGFDLTTAEQVATELSVSGDPAGALARLVDASMVDAFMGNTSIVNASMVDGSGVDTEWGAHPRYRMLETLRAFGRDRLAADGEEKPALERLLRWAVATAKWIGAAEVTAQEPAADAALRRELANLRAAWRLARQWGRLDQAVALLDGVLVAASSRDLSEVWQWARELGDDPALTRHPRRVAAAGMAAGAAWLRGELTEAERLGRAGLAAATDTAAAGNESESDDDRWWCEAALANTALSQGRYSDAVAHALAAAALAARPTEHPGIAALAAAYAGDLDRAEALNDQLAPVAASPTLRAMYAYVAGEIDNAAGQYRSAATHYHRAITLSRAAGATFIDGIASVGLVTVDAAAGQITEALRGYRRLLDYWERTGSWLQQWTTLRNLAGLLHRLGDHEAALFLALAADHAPDAPAVSGPVWPDPPPGASALPAATLTRIRVEATSASSPQILAVARRSIDAHLATAPTG